MRNPLLVIIAACLLLSSTLKSQELSILKADNSWGKEIIKFPIEWAPKITHEGFEELRFAPNWSDVSNAEYWTLVMAWQLETDTLLSKEILKQYLYSYFEGLMKPNHWAEKFPDPKLSLKQETSNDTNGLQLTGKMTLFDGFHTGKVITINIKGEETLDNENKLSTVIFRFSPKAFNHAIWDDLGKIQSKPNNQ